MKAIEIDSLVKKYKNGVLALNGLNIEVEQGEIFSLLGPNGAGKSSLLNILSTYYVMTSGDVKILGRNLISDAQKIRREIACVAQRISIDEHLSLLDNMWFQSRLYGVEKHLAKERIDSLISSFGLKNYLQYPVLSYSGGIKRRLDIAMNMVSMPKILFLDEPTVGMDVESRKMLWDMIRKIKTQYGTTIFLTTHYLEEADQLSDTICIMKNGKEIIQGPPQSLKAYTNQNIVKIRFNDENTCKKTFAFFKSKNLWIYKREKFEIYLKVNEKAKEFQKINKILLEENIVFSAVEIVEPSLEDVFLSMIETSKEGALL